MNVTRINVSIECMCYSLLFVTLLFGKHKTKIQKYRTKSSVCYLRMHSFLTRCACIWIIVFCSSRFSYRVEPLKSPRKRAKLYITGHLCNEPDGRTHWQEPATSIKRTRNIQFVIMKHRITVYSCETRITMHRYFLCRIYVTLLIPETTSRISARAKRTLHIPLMLCEHRE